MSDLDKITEQHRHRRAIVYVRQSSPGQVQNNHESRALQYALRNRAIELGWPVESVAVVDEDLARSASSTNGRLGFKDLVAEVGLGRVGLILGIEVSRLARNNADWYQLLDLCPLTGTLVADSDGIYCPGNFNDRMLLGLKGTLAEAELHLIRARLDGGLRHKAARGELELSLPVGLDRDEDGRIVLSADEQVRHAIGRVFELWRRLGSARQVVICLRDEGQRLPRRTVGERRVRWMPASYGAVHAFLINPAYAGAFVFGRTAQRRQLDEQGRVRRRTVELPIERWSVCLPEHHPGYVSWQEYLATRERLRRNVRPSGEGGGAVREGQALLQGILRCGRCGRRMQVAYSGRAGRSPRYACVRAFHHHGAERACQSLGGQRLDDAVSAAFLEAVTPAGVRACAEAVGELERQHEERLRGQRLAVERAEFEARRAQRQFDACEPENRLVARTLERAWEQALSRLEGERRKLADLEARRPEPLTQGERQALARLARDLPKLWSAATTTPRDRKELLRTLVSEVVVTIKQPPRRGEVEIIWEGGACTELQVPLIRRGGERRRTSENTVALIRRLAAHTADQQIAAILNKQGRRTGTGLPFNQPRVKHVRQQHGIPAAPPADPDSGLVTIEQAAAELGVSNATVYRWLHAGLLPGEQTTPHAPWRIRLTHELRSRFVPDVPDGYLPLDQAAKALGCARQTVLHKVQRGELDAVQVVSGRRKGLRIKVTGPTVGLFDI
ncbi:MAG: recombinase family protein [Solirubrobacterales bacterium]|nr:recombinase family protein [Solirubrobacterales bacterium]